MVIVNKENFSLATLGALYYSIALETGYMFQFVIGIFLINVVVGLLSAFYTGERLSSKKFINGFIFFFSCVCVVTFLIIATHEIPEKMELLNNLITLFKYVVMSYYFSSIISNLEKMGMQIPEQLKEWIRRDKKE